MRQIRPILVSLIAALAAQLVPAIVFAQGTQPADVPIPFTRHVLDNGLTLLVHEDHKAPIVAVNVWYHVGSKNEPVGRTGFAHLFEHLMFNGSENVDTDYFEVLEPLGATDLNGTTNQDRTNYFQNVPTTAVDLALWMESDRMGHLLGAVDQERLDEQRGVVQNEKRQGENQPYGRVWEEIYGSTYPAGHPYSHSVIGSMEDLDAASLEDVHEWFQTYYGPQNAVLVVAGDIDVATAISKVEKYFGDIPPGPPIARHATWIAPRTGEHRHVMQDRVPHARVYMVWNVPEWRSEDLTWLSLAGSVLASGKTSRLYKRLVYEDQIATGVSAYASSREIGSYFVINATAQPDVDLSVVETTLREELDRFLAEGPTAAEMQRVKTQRRASFLRGIERVGGFGGKSDRLAQGEVYAGDPAFYLTQNERVETSTAQDVQEAARRWLSDGVFTMEVQPFPELMASGAGADRSALPIVGTPPIPEFPQVQRATLSNGLEVVLAERSDLPLVRMQLLVDAGYAADPAIRPGLASMTATMMDEGTMSRSSLQISEELALLGASIGSGANLDLNTVSLSALKANLDPSLDLFVDVIRNPSFPESELERQRRQRLAGIQQEMAQPMGRAMRKLPPLLYGTGHAYSQPLTGSGTVASVEAMTRQDLQGFHQTWYTPDNATLVVAGDVTLPELIPQLEEAFGSWERGNAPAKNLAAVSAPTAAEVFILDKPGAPQSVVLAAQLIPPTANPDEVAFETMNTVLGGAFISRINMNLREDKHWSYGARSFAWDAAGQRPFVVYAAVQTDKTAESLQEIRNEIEAIRGPRPVTEEELAKAVDNIALSLPGSWETINSVSSSLTEIVRFGLPDDYFDTYADAIRGVSSEDASAVARQFLDPDRMVWVVVGDRVEIEDKIRELGFGEVRVLTEDVPTPEPIAMAN
jgi:zinc protease